MPTVPAEWSGPCRWRTADGRCAQPLRVPLTATPVPGTRPVRYHLLGQGTCPDGHPVFIDREYLPKDGPVIAREVGGGLPGLGRHHH